MSDNINFKAIHSLLTLQRTFVYIQNIKLFKVLTVASLVDTRMDIIQTSMYPTPAVHQRSPIAPTEIDVVKDRLSKVVVARKEVMTMVKIVER